MLKFSDFADELDFPLEKKAVISDVLCQDIIIKDYEVSNSKSEFNEMFTIHIDFKDEPYKLRTSSIGLKNQLDKYSNKFPFQTKIVKNGRTFKFT